MLFDLGIKTAVTLLLTLFVLAEGGAVESWTHWRSNFKFIDYGPQVLKKRDPCHAGVPSINDVIQSR